MSHPADTCQPRALWLDTAIRRVLALPNELSLNEGAVYLAIVLLRSIEADDLPAPEVWSQRGKVMVRWDCGDRSLTLAFVGPDCYRVGRTEGGRTYHVMSIRRCRVEKLRSLVAWLDPSANRTDVTSWMLKKEW